MVPNPYTLLGLNPVEAKFFTCLDLKDAFFCMHLAPQSQPIFAFQWEHSYTGEKTIDLDSVVTRLQNSPIIFVTALVSDLKAFSADTHGCRLLQHRPSVGWTNSGRLYGMNLPPSLPFVEGRI
jgi:hypothetical protein